MNFSSNLINSLKASSYASFSVLLFLMSSFLWWWKVYLMVSVKFFTKYSRKSNPFWSIFFKLIFKSLLAAYFNFSYTNCIYLIPLQAKLLRRCMMVLPSPDSISKLMGLVSSFLNPTRLIFYMHIFNGVYFFLFSR